MRITIQQVWWALVLSVALTFSAGAGAGTFNLGGAVHTVASNPTGGTGGG
jgi:hypothetical protein